jgi:hypothetical protein
MGVEAIRKTSMSSSQFLSRAVLAAAVGLSNPAFAGPPMATEDPDILDPGQWEFIAAATQASVDNEGKIGELPIVEASVGLSENTQVTLAYPFVYIDPEGGPRRSDTGNLEIGAKWRFYNRDNLQITFAPLYLFGISTTAATLGFGSDDPVAVLPVSFGYTFGDWTLMGELGYAASKSEEDEVAYGLILGHPVGDRVQLMFELYGAGDSEMDDRFLNFNIGAEIAIAAGWNLLVSAGSGISEPSGAEELEYTAFVGVQYLTGN